MGLLLFITVLSNPVGESFSSPFYKRESWGSGSLFVLPPAPLSLKESISRIPSSRTHANWGWARSQWFYLRDSRGTDSQRGEESAWIWIPLSPHTAWRFSPHRGDPHLQQSPKHLKVEPCSSIERPSVSIKKSSRSPYWRQVSMATAKRGLVFHTCVASTHSSTASRIVAS